MSNLDTNPGVLAFGARHYAMARTDNIIEELNREIVDLRRQVSLLKASYKEARHLVDKYRYEAGYDTLTKTL